MTVKADLELATTEQLVDELSARLSILGSKYVFAFEVNQDEREKEGEAELMIIVHNKRYLKKAQKWFMKIFGGEAIG